MKRLMENQLTRWLQKPRRKPLVIRGARQVGKSTLVQNFTRSQGLKLAEINLEKHGNLNSIFGTNDLDIIIPELELLARTSLRQENTLLFLDEITITGSGSRLPVGICSSKARLFHAGGPGRIPPPGPHDF